MYISRGYSVACIDRQICSQNLACYYVTFHGIYMVSRGNYCIIGVSYQLCTSARGVLFTLSRPKGLRVGPIVEKYAEFRNPFLKKIPTELFSQIEIKQGYPLFKISHTNFTH